MDKKLEKLACVRCGTKFLPKNVSQTYCSRKCRNRSSQDRLRERAKLATQMKAAV